MTNSYLEFNASELNRQPSKVFQAAKQQPVLLKRRSGTDMILVSKRELLARAEALERAALILSALVSPEKSRLDNLRLRFPWMALFEEAKERECADELLAGAKEFLGSGVALPFTSILHKWTDLARESAKSNSSDRRSRAESVPADEN